MKLLLPLLVILVTQLAFGQTEIKPGKRVVNQRWVQPGTYTMTWYMLRGSSRSEMGKVTTTLSENGKNLVVETRVQLKGMNTPWIDSTVADRRTLQPVFHSSSNMQRDMRIWFGKVVRGWHYDKMKKTTTERLDTLAQDYFDSNLYPALIGWLPLKEGYRATLKIYDFNPDARSGVLRAFVQEVKSDTITLGSGTPTAVWAVKVSDEIGNGENGTSTYYFSKANRKLLQQKIVAGKREMLMELSE